MGTTTNRGGGAPATNLDLVLGTKDDPNAITSALATASAHFHLIAPATKVSRLPIGTSVALTAVTVDPATETYPLGDGGKVGLGKDALCRIGSALGIDWDPPRRTDDGSTPNVWSYEAVGYIRGFDGARERVVGTKVLDVRDGSSTVSAILDRCRGTEAKFAKLPRGKPLPPELEGKAREKARVQIRDLRLYGDRHAATKAQLAAIRTRVRGSWTVAELAKPFVVARLAWTGAGVDPAQAAEMTFRAMTGAIGAAYPAPAAPPRSSPVIEAVYEEVEEPAAPPPPAARPAPYTPPADVSTVSAPAPATTQGARPAPSCAMIGQFSGLGPAATCRDGTPDDPDWWCEGCRADAAATSPDVVPPSGVKLPFGRSKGMDITEAPDDDLVWMRDAVEKSIDDPDKARFRSRNEALRDAIVAELGRRGA